MSGGDSGGFYFGRNGDGSDIDKAPLDPLVTGSGGSGSFRSNSNGNGNEYGSSSGDAYAEKAPPVPLVSETVHNKRAEDDGGPVLEVE